jgi:chaperonin cofactor prefoldin
MMSTTQLDKRLSPEEEEVKGKQAQLSQLEEQLAEVLATKSTLERDLQDFMSRSTQAMASEYAKLDRWTIRCEELEWTLAKLKAELKADDPDPPNEADWESQRRAEFKGRWREAGEQAELADEEPAAPIGPERRVALRKLYRALARRFHPDLGDTEEEMAMRHVMMAKINVAYQTGDLEALERLVEEPDPKAPVDEGVGERLIRLIRQIARARASLADAQGALSELESGREAELMRLCVDIGGAENFEALLKTVQAEIDVQRDRWCELRELESELRLELDQ